MEDFLSKKNIKVGILNFYGYIYKTTCLLDGEIYVGQSIPHHTLTEYGRGYLGSGTILGNKILLYGRKAFVKEILCDNIGNQRLLNNLELSYQLKFKCHDRNIGSNIIKGAATFKDNSNPMFIPEVVEKSVVGKAKHYASPEGDITRAKIGAASKLRNQTATNPMTGKKRPGNKIKPPALGMKHSAASKEKISKAGIGRIKSVETIARLSKSLTGVKKTEQHKLNYRNSRLAKKFGVEYIKDELPGKLLIRIKNKK